MYPLLLFVILFSLFELFPIISSKSEHPQRDYGKKYEQIGALAIYIPISIDSVE